MDKSAILWAPDAGWLDITVNNLRDLGKADEVVLLLRRLPYLACQPDASYRCWSSSHWILSWLECVRWKQEDNIETGVILTEGSLDSDVEDGTLLPQIIGLATNPWGDDHILPSAHVVSTRTGAPRESARRQFRPSRPYIVRTDGLISSGFARTSAWHFTSTLSPATASHAERAPCIGEEIGMSV